MSSLSPRDADAFRHQLPVDGLTSPQQAYAELMKVALGPALREAGLRGSNGRFQLPSVTHWALVGFQKSAYSDRYEVRFTVNLSVIGRDVWTAQSAAQPHLGAQPAPTPYYGSWADQVRIGLLTPGGQDKWWRIMRGADLAAVRDDMLADLLNYGVPWLRERATA